MFNEAGLNCSGVKARYDTLLAAFFPQTRELSSLGSCTDESEPARRWTPASSPGPPPCAPPCGSAGLYSHHACGGRVDSGPPSPPSSGPSPRLCWPLLTPCLRRPGRLPGCVPEAVPSAATENRKAVRVLALWEPPAHRQDQGHLKEAASQGGQMMLGGERGG